MFGSLGLPELSILLILGVLLVGYLRRGSLATAGPALVLRKFEVNPSKFPAVIIEGRPSGFVAWLLTTLRIDTLTSLTVTDKQVSFKKASLSGEIHQIVPTTSIASTHCAYSRPIWLLILGAVILLLAALSALSNRDAAQTFIAGILIAGVCGVMYLLQRKLTITVETTGGMGMGLAFKPSAIEHVSISLKDALNAIDRINSIVVTVSTLVGKVADEQSRNCPTCGAELSADESFCSECGAKIGS